MNYQTTITKLDNLHTDCIIIAVDHDKKLNKTGKQLDRLMENYLSDLIARGDLEGETGKSLLLPLDNDQLQRVLIVNVGDTKELSGSRYQKVLRKTTEALKHYHIDNCVSTLHEITVRGLDLKQKIQQFVLAAQHSFYVFDQCKTEKNKASLHDIHFLVDAKTRRSATQAIQYGEALGEGMTYCQDLGNMPPNICNPSYLAKEAEKLATQYKKISASHLNENDMKKLGMGAFLSVSQASTEPGKLITMHYKGKANKAPVVLVGKGITFDTGGTNLKPSAGMADMKYDMCGAASVFGVIKAAAELNLPINLIGVVASAENMIDGGGNRPSDIVKTLSGKTVEILNTDAEGRLVLCDALTYIAKHKPAMVIDVATLTGGAIAALGFETTTLFSNDQALAKRLLKAGEKSLDPAWQLPMNDEGYSHLESNHADLSNVRQYGDSSVKAMVGACFLSKFTEDYCWAHLDIAGTAVVYGQNKHATGRPVPLLLEFLSGIK